MSDVHNFFKLSMLVATENEYLQLRLATSYKRPFPVRSTILSGQMLYL